MITLIYNNSQVVISGEYTKSILDMVRDVCSYKVVNADWSTKFQEGVWDGTISVFNGRSKSFPAGMLPLVTEMLDNVELEYQIKDIRKKPAPQAYAKLDLHGLKFRDYQEESIAIIKEKERGILGLCTGAGKTKASCGVIAELSVYPVIFVVPSVSLLKQTVAEFQESLQPLVPEFGVGELGGGVCRIYEQGVNVATYHTLLTAFDKKYVENKHKMTDIFEQSATLPALENQLRILNVDLDNSDKSRRTKIKTQIRTVEKKIAAKMQQIEDKAKIRELCSKCQLLFIDETHIAAEIIEYLALRCENAYYRCGLSATPMRMDNQDVRMFGATGPVVKRTTASDLIQRGYLVKPYIYMVDLNVLPVKGASYPEMYKNSIVQSEARNSLIRDLASEMHQQGRPTLILVERLEHGKILEGMIPNSLFVPGKDGSDDSPISDEEMDYRRAQLRRLENREIIMIATQWANTGIDAPKVSCLILAGTVSSPVTTIQQVGRVLRKAEGKRDCVVFDFRMGQSSLRRHGASRLKAYKTEPEFEVKILRYSELPHPQGGGFLLQSRNYRCSVQRR